MNAREQGEAAQNARESRGQAFQPDWRTFATHGNAVRLESLTYGSTQEHSVERRVGFKDEVDDTRRDRIDPHDL
jgi:hypothetical protein